MPGILAVAIGGAVGSAARYLVGVSTLRAFGSGFPVGTILVNVLGCFIMGVIAELLALRFNASETVRLLLTTGFLGGFTTFSAFSLDFAVLWRRGETMLALGYSVGSVVFSILALFAGLLLVRTVS